MSKSGIIGLFALLYFVQGAAQSYFRNFQKPYLSDLGIEASSIALLSTLLLLPFIIKIFFGYISDRYNVLGFGHRKPYLVIGLVIAVAGFMLSSTQNPANNFVFYAACIVLAAFGVALFDATADGLAIEVSSEKDQGLVQSSMIAGKAAGIILLAQIFGSVIEHWGYRYVFYILAAVALIPLFLVFRVKEKSRTPTQDNPKISHLKKIFVPGYGQFIMYGITYTMVSFGIDGLLTLFLRKTYAVSESSIGNFGALSGVGAVIGAILAGVLMAKKNNKVVAYGSLIAVALGALASGTLLNPNSMLSFAVVWGVIWAFQETVFVTFAMRFSQNIMAASSFALLMALSNVGEAITQNISLNLADQYGFTSVFIGLSVFIIVPAWFLNRSLKIKNYQK